MTDPSRLPLHMLAAAFMLAILGDLLLRTGPWGLNLAIWVSVLTATLYGLAAYHRLGGMRDALWLATVALHFAAAFAWLDSPALKVIDALALMAALAVGTLGTDGIRIRRAAISDYAFAHIAAGIDAVAGTPELIREARWPAATRRPILQKVAAVGAGALLSLPLLLVFGALLVAADAVFASMVSSALSFDLDRILSHAIPIGFLTWIMGGYLRGTLLPRKRDLKEALKAGKPMLGIVEVAVPLSLLIGLFLAFVIVQLRYLFGDGSLVEATTGLTYAEYARRGFFELVTVSALTLPLLLVADWALERDGVRDRRLFQGLATALLALLLIIMLSALKRMSLYVSAYGLTEQRLYATAFMLWLAVVFIWFAATVLRNRRNDFAFGAMVAGCALVAALNVFNADAFIVKVNVERRASGKVFDALYASSLSADAVPTLIEALPSLSEERRCMAAVRLLERWSPPVRRDWRSWNRSRSRARRLVGERYDELEAMACPLVSHAGGAVTHEGG